MIFFFNDTATTEIYTLSLHDALPILMMWRQSCNRCRGRLASRSRTWSMKRYAAASPKLPAQRVGPPSGCRLAIWEGVGAAADRKSTRLNSSHANISYAVFCLKKKNKQ